MLHTFKFKLFFVIAFNLILFFPSTTQVFAGTDTSVEHLIDLANKKKISEFKQWARLLHYNQGGSLHSRQQSYVTSEHFFLSKTGKKDPRAELEENIRQLFGNDIQKRCIFPARFHWLSEQLELEDYSLGLKHCTDFLKVQKEVSAKKITLVFPSAYLNSASSVFGHTLLRIDTSDHDEAVILNWAINYGAKLSEGDGAIKYALKGITGFYEGQYFIVPYSQKIKEYGQMENRDIWEYPLALSQEEVTLLTEHLWELKDINFNYFFFDENCSYRLLELLEVAKPELDLTSQFRLTEIPLNTVKTLHENQLIETSIFRPSKERLLHHHFSQLSNKEKKLSRAISEDTSQIDDNAFKTLAAPLQLLILQSAYDYLRFKQSAKERDSEVAKVSLELLQNINRISIQLGEANTTQIDSSSTTKQVIENDGDILNTHDSHRLSITAGKVVDGNNYKSIQYRMAYHDLLDNSEGFFKGAQINGPSVTFKNNNSKNVVDQLTVVDIISLNPLTSFRQDLSWNLGIKSERSEEYNTQLQTSIYGGGGYTIGVDNFLIYQLLSPRLAINSEFNEHIKAGIDLKLGLIYNSGKHPSLLEFNALKLQDEEIKYFSNFSQQFEISRNHALRAKLKYFQQRNKALTNTATILKIKSFELSYLYYF